VVVTSGQLKPDLTDGLQSDVQEPIPWSDEAEARMQNIPPFAQNMARKAIEDFARTGGHDEVTADVMNRAREQMGM
jgi:hypothetical protein